MKPQDWVIAVPAVLALLFGTIGFAILEKPKPPPPFDDPFFRAVGILFGSAAGANQNLPLCIARWFAVLFGFAAGTRFLARNLGEQLTVFLTRRARHHEVLIGLGRKGRTLLDLPPAVDDQTKVSPWRFWPVRRVGLDRELAPAQEAYLSRRSFVVTGDATTDEALQDVNIGAARRVVIATKEDALNIAIAAQIATFRRRANRKGPLDIFVHVADPVLRNEAFPAVDPEAPVFLHPFALPATAARALLRRFPVAERARAFGAPGVNLILVGFDAYAEAVMVQALRLGRLVGQHPPHVTIFAANGAEVEDSLRRRYPALVEDEKFGLREAVSVVAFDPARELGTAELLPTESTDRRVTAVFVQAESDAAAYTLALRTRRTARAHGMWKAPFFVRLDEPADLARSLTYLPASSSKDLADSSPILEEVLEPYGALRSTLEASVNANEPGDSLARELHNEYLIKHSHDPRPVPRDDWKRLAEEARESNRRAIDHFELKLASAGFVRAGSGAPKRPLDLSKGPHGHELGPLEHESWAREKLLAGWRFGMPRDNLRKRHDCLVAFDELPPSLRARDAEQIDDVEKVMRRVASEPSVLREHVIFMAADPVSDAVSLRDGLRRALEGMNAWGRLGPDGEELFTFVTTLAPGPDCCLARAIVELLGQAFAGRYRLRVVRSLPLPLLLASWGAQGGLALGSPDGRTSPQACAIEARAEPLEPDLAKIAQLLDRFVKDPTNQVNAVIDLSPSESLVTPAADRGGSSSEGLERVAEEAARRTERYVLKTAQTLIAFCDQSRYAGSVASLVRAWKAEKHKGEGLQVIEVGSEGRAAAAGGGISGVPA